MTTTGTNTFTMTRDDLIKAVMRNLQALGAGETPITEDYTNITQAMNIVIKSWAKKSIALWVTQEVTVPMVTGVAKYPLGPTAGYVQSVTATGGTGYAASGTWTATNGTTGTAASGTFTSAAGVLTFTVVVPGDSYTSAPTTFTTSSGSGATFTAVIVGKTMSRPLRVIEGTFIRNSNGYDTPLMLISRQEYDILGSKTTSGIPNQFYYDNQIPNGVLTVYNVAADSTATIYAQTQRQFYDMVSSGDNFDFPSEWFQALKWGLTEELMLEYRVPREVFPYVIQKAAEVLDESFSFSQEEASVFFSPDPRMQLGRMGSR